MDLDALEYLDDQLVFAAVKTFLFSEVLLRWTLYSFRIREIVHQLQLRIFAFREFFDVFAVNGVLELPRVNDKEPLRLIVNVLLLELELQQG